MLNFLKFNIDQAEPFVVQVAQKVTMTKVNKKFKLFSNSVPFPRDRMKGSKKLRS